MGIIAARRKTFDVKSGKSGVNLGYSESNNSDTVAEVSRIKKFLRWFKRREYNDMKLAVM